MKKSLMNMTIMVMFLLIICVQGVFSSEDNVKEFDYLYFQVDDQMESNKVAYSIDFEDNSSKYFFEMRIEYNGIIQNKTCEKELTSDFRKIICEVPKYGNGEYLFIATLRDDLGENKILVNREYLYGQVTSSVSFQDDENKTIVFVKLSGEAENLVVKHRIPKEAIESLTPENKNDLITTDFDYEIIEEDPLIAWNIDRAPVDINYTINKKVSEEAKADFNVEEITSQPYFNYLKLSIFVMMLAILAFLLMPVFTKRKKVSKT